MLNLTVCGKCWSEVVENNVVVPPPTYCDTLAECPLVCVDGRTIANRCWVPVAGPPPQWCQHKLEHAMSEAMTETKEGRHA